MENKTLLIKLETGEETTVIWDAQTLYNMLTHDEQVGIKYEMMLIVFDHLRTAIDKKIKDMGFDKIPYTGEPDDNKL